MNKLILLLLFFSLITGVSFAATPSASEIERSQELIQQEEMLRKEIEKAQKVFIKNIVVSGAAKLSQNQIKTATLPFIKKWLTKEDIEQLIDTLKTLYTQNRFPQPEISYLIEDEQLKITVNEKNQ